VPPTHRVFVYGSLKRGCSNHHYLREAKFIGPFVTVPRYRMLESAVPIFFPVLLPDPQGRQVAGEVYQVDDKTLAALDGLERIATGAYTREMIELNTEGGGGDVELACIYIGGARWAESGCPVYGTTNAAGALDWRR
jgi:gamma-glutamylaminecyclotransferase